MIAVTDLLQRRLATRAFSPDPIDGDTIADLIDAARLTPSCRNNQPWRFYFLETPQARALGLEALSADNRVWAERAPLLVVAWARETDDCVNFDGRSWYTFDLGMAVMNLMLAATEMDLVARPMAGFDAEILRDRLKLGAADDPMVVVAIGYPSTDDAHVPEHYRGVRPRVRKSADEIVRRL